MTSICLDIHDIHSWLAPESATHLSVRTVLGSGDGKQDSMTVLEYDMSWWPWFAIPLLQLLCLPNPYSHRWAVTLNPPLIDAISAEGYFHIQHHQISEPKNYWQILGKLETMIAYCSQIFPAFSDHLPCNLIFVIEYLSFFRRLFKGVLKDLPLYPFGSLYFNNSSILFWEITERSDTINFVCFMHLFTDFLCRETWIYGGFAKKVCNSQGSIVQKLHGHRTQTRGHRL